MTEPEPWTRTAEDHLARLDELLRGSPTKRPASTEPVQFPRYRPSLRDRPRFARYRLADLLRTLADRLDGSTH